MGESELTQVFYCDNHKEGIAVTSEDTTQVCPKCSNQMKLIGWFEYGE